MFTFGLPWAKNRVVSMGKRFKLRGGSYQEESHALRTFAQKFSNIDFVLKILPLKYNELVMSEM